MGTQDCWILFSIKLDETLVLIYLNICCCEDMVTNTEALFVV